MEFLTRTDRKLVKKCHIFDLYEDTVVSPTGHVAKWDFLKHNGAAAIVPVTDDGKILMVRQYRNSIDGVSLEIPAGKKDTKDEPSYDCASRELEEETGYRCEHLEFLIHLVTAIAYCDEEIDIYVAKDLIPSGQHLDEDEFIDLQAYDVDVLKQMIFEGKLTDAKTVAAIMSYCQKYGR